MYLCDRGGTFPDCAAHSLDGPGADVADCEHAGNARLEWSRHVPRGTTCGRLTGRHEAVSIERDTATGEPASLRICAHEQEYMTDRLFFFDTGPGVSP